MSAVVEFRRIAYSVPRDAGRLAILEDLSFTVDAGETLVLLGRSGSGKTTAIKMVNRLIAPTSGEVLVEGKPTAGWDPIRLRRASVCSSIRPSRPRMIWSYIFSTPPSPTLSIPTKPTTWAARSFFG